MNSSEVQRSEWLGTQGDTTCDATKHFVGGYLKATEQSQGKLSLTATSSYLFSYSNRHMPGSLGSRKMFLLSYA